MPDFVQALDPPEFTEAIALACDVDVSDFQLGRSKLFCRPGKGAFLEDLKDRDLSEVIPILVAKIKEWEVHPQPPRDGTRTHGAMAIAPAVHRPCWAEHHRLGLLRHHHS
jgi:hypothetical protein